MPKNDVTATLDLAAEALHDDNPERALSHLDKVELTSDVATLKAEALVMLDRWEDAEALLQEAARKDPENPSVLLSAAELALDAHPDDHDAVREAGEMALRAEELARRVGQDDLIPDCMLTHARAVFTLGDLAGAVIAFEETYEAAGKPDEILVELAMAQFEAMQLDKARTALEGLRQHHPDDARVHHYLGLMDERAGRAKEAQASFDRAHKLDPEEFPRPIALSEDQFEQIVQEAFDGMPERIRSALDNVPIMIEPLPSDDDLKGDPPLSPLSLGMFRGRAVGEVSVMDPWTQMPSSILLFQKNLERYARTRDELVEEIETTLLHEVGHFVGWDEDELYERGLD